MGFSSVSQGKHLLCIASKPEILLQGVVLMHQDQQIALSVEKLSAAWSKYGLANAHLRPEIKQQFY